MPLDPSPSGTYDSAAMRKDPSPSGTYVKASKMPLDPFQKGVYDSATMRKDRTRDNERFVHMLKGRIDQFALSLASSDTKNYIQQLVIEPFLQYIIQRFFPYLVIALCIFCGMLILVILIFVLQLMNRNSVCSACMQTMMGTK
uniref:Uncharacterized protein n=1 Tax=viral metagenome TaxID=1070528 RepID=A0A6C0HKU1_9ZZZZ